MKTAEDGNGHELAAGEDSPPEAICPACGRTVTLRKRRLMNNRGYTYYWRHRAGSHGCPKRGGFPTWRRNNK